MSDDQFPHDESITRPTAPESSPQDEDRRESEPPASSSWSTVSPWGTPGDHLTGPIPRIRKRDDGSMTHGEES